VCIPTLTAVSSTTPIHFRRIVAVKIRLKRFGKIRSPHYRIVVADSRTKRDGRVIEEIGKYHPTEEPSFIEINSERAQYWLSVGAQPTEQVTALLKLSGDWGRFKGDKNAVSTIRVKEPTVPFQADAQKKAVLKPKEEKKAPAAAVVEVAETAPVEAAPVEAAPVETAPVETAPVETAPVETAEPAAEAAAEVAAEVAAESTPVEA
jgi:small subunit ribosomal protein S16